MHRQPTPADVARRFEEWLVTSRDGRRGAVGGCFRMGGGLETWIYLVDVDHPPWPSRIVVRLHQHAEHADKVQVERAALQWAQASGIRAPLYVDGELSQGSPLGAPFIVETALRGKPGATGQYLRRRRREAIFPQMAATQARMHALAPPEHGVPKLDIVSALREIETGPAGRDPAFTEPIAWARDHLRVVETTPRPSALHLDFHHGNVLVNEHGLTVVDWAGMRVGDPDADVARTLEVIGAGARVIGIRPLIELVTVPSVRHYLHEYEQHRTVDRDRLRFWCAWHAMVASIDLRQTATEGSGSRLQSAVCARASAVALRRCHEIALRSDGGI